MDKKRPRGRDVNYTGGGSGVHKRGEGLGTGPVGAGDGDSGRKRGNGSGSSGGKRAAIGGGLSLPVIIIAVLFLLFKNGGLGGLTSLFGGGSDGESQTESQAYEEFVDSTYSGSEGYNSGSAYSGAAVNASSAQLDTSVAPGSRAKRTAIRGGGQDNVTIMVYMCGTDLESQHGMASSDLGEMAAAKYGDNVKIIVYTGGCKKWKTSAISSSYNQIYQVADGGLKRLVDNDGAKLMTDPATLSAFIKWTAEHYPANRYELIFWDHGGGSISGYGYDEKFANKGSMSLAGINKALKAGGVTFDFIGFDACLMATAETALMLNSYADYMIASEETEPGIGWYYTNWLTKLGKDTSLSTLEIGKTIADDFVYQCGKKCAGQKTTLSVIDLAEFANTVPAPLTNFSKSVSKLISNNDYKTVSDARYTTREFATSSKIDQVDFVDLANKVGTAEGKALARALQGAVKYNRTSSNMTNAYGVSIYFPYMRASYVDSVCNTYDAIGMDDDYAKAIKQFASMEVSGQVAGGGSSGSMGSLFGSLLGGLGGFGGGASSSTGGSADMIGDLLGSFLGGGSGMSGLISGLTGSNSKFLSERAMGVKETAEYISMNYFDPTNLVWDERGADNVLMDLPENQWKLVHSLDKNVFYDDGEGYIDLGWDNDFDYTKDGKLIASTDRTWISINGQVVAYYHEDTTEVGDDYCITGRVPALLNGTRVNLWLVFDNAHPYGYIAGAQTDYQEKATKTVAKNLTELSVGDKLDFLCDYYSYDGDYQDSYYLGEQMTVGNSMKISNTDVGDGKVLITYRFTDIYNQAYWTPSLER